MRRHLAVLATALLVAPAAWSQGTGIDMGGLTQDTGLPVEVDAEQLEVNQTDGTAVFTGGVTVTQGEMTLTAERVQVVYASGEQGRIQEMQASGGVTLVTPEEAAESQEAVYEIESGNVTMTGEVLLTQGPNTLSSDRLVIDLTTGTGTMEGGVRTIFQTGDN
ncbi:lipopolysaccharide export system protein LptA [Tranquillimonas rosea]|uniref:Lipopolysaccharide export system protein LptA n=1 Tax=Tranquillimonas rosea TaxID=641238 RepID=A0A1H9UJQ4_9RHOB|nr:LptA/OstA family protein [Tranquillimonas rosea]SES09528.1 lipopolysaccharide export system protein LptA [Tranquillimonas rosea]